jgi:hypothetical protein
VKEGSYARERAVKPFGRNVVIKVVISDGPRVGCRRGRGEIGSLRRPPSAKGRQGKHSGGIKRESYIFMDVPEAPIQSNFIFGLTPRK